MRGKAVTSEHHKTRSFTAGEDRDQTSLQLESQDEEIQERSKVSIHQPILYCYYHIWRTEIIQSLASDQTVCDVIPASRQSRFWTFISSVSVLGCFKIKCEVNSHLFI